MGKNALEDLSMQALARIARGESVSGIDDSEIGAYGDDEDYESVEGIDDSDIGAVKKRLARKPAWKGRKVLGLGSFSIAAAGTHTFDVSPLEDFKPQRFVATGTGLLVQSINVQGHQQFLNGESVPVTLFSGTGSDLNFMFEMCPANGHITVVVSNPTVAAVTCDGAFLGLYK
jgi:hypothetical protein